MNPQCNLLDVLSWAEDGLPKGSLLVCSGVQIVKNNLLKVCLNLLDREKEGELFKYNSKHKPKDLVDSVPV